MKLYIYATLFISLNSIAQSDIKIDSVFNRSNLNNYFTHGLDYYKMPNSYTQLIEFSAIVINDGAVMETNCYLKVDVLYNNSVIYSDSSNSVTINSMGSDSLVVLTPLDMSTESIGDYTFIYSVYSYGF